jgi:hypothetical protein
MSAKEMQDLAKAEAEADAKEKAEKQGKAESANANKNVESLLRRMEKVEKNGKELVKEDESE